MISVSFDTAPILRAFDDMTRKQIPFATARALTLTAKEAQANVKAHLPDDFTVRNNWLASGIRVNAASKTHLVAEVGSRDKFMQLQAEGGDKTGKQAVPEEARQLPTSITPRSKWPGRLLKGKGPYFIGKMRSGKMGLWMRVGDGRLPIVLEYAFERVVHVKARWHFTPHVEETVRKRWAILCAKCLADAIRSAK